MNTNKIMLVILVLTIGAAPVCAEPSFTDKQIQDFNAKARTLEKAKAKDQDRKLNTYTAAGGVMATGAILAAVCPPLLPTFHAGLIAVTTIFTATGLGTWSCFVHDAQKGGRNRSEKASFLADKVTVEALTNTKVIAAANTVKNLRGGTASAIFKYAGLVLSPLWLISGALHAAAWFKKKALRQACDAWAQTNVSEEHKDTVVDHLVKSLALTGDGSKYTKAKEKEGEGIFLSRIATYWTSFKNKVSKAFSRTKSEKGTESEQEALLEG